MKNLITTIILSVGVLFYATAQDKVLQNWRPNDQRGLNVFETKKDTSTFEGFKVRIGGDFALQFQSLDQSNTNTDPTFEPVELGSNFNLPTANLNLDVQFIDGVRMHLRTYLSARHHEEAWVKGGYLQIDKLDFIKEGFLEGVMQYTTLRVGMDEFDYGDAHYRRTDNARAIYNPFVGNYIMDAFSTEAFGEVTFQMKGFVGVLGVTNGKLNQSVVVNSNTDNKLSFFGKLGYDNQFSEDFRFRLTGSWYINNGTTTGTWLYGGDRGGARYYNIMQTATEGGDFDGRYNARYTKLTAFQINPFIKFKGLEFFGVYEIADGGNDIAATKEGKATQIAGEVLYRFGKNEKFYLGGRYNTVSATRLDSDTDNLDISRVNLGGGWYISKNILTKIEYVNQQYKGDAWTGRFEGAEFSGIMIEAAISF